MTHCYSGGARHDFPVEDSTGAHCPEHGVTLLWHGPPITDADFPPADRGEGDMVAEVDTQ